MSKILFCISIISGLLLFSCKKSENGTPSIPPPPVPSNLLVKIVSKSGSDSVITEYTYDANKRLVFEKKTSVTSGTLGYDNLKISRDNTGMISSIVEKADYLFNSGIDSLLTFFNSFSGRYLYSVMVFHQGAVAVRDSVWYTYDGNGRHFRDQHFQFISGNPSPQIFRQEYIYSSSGNIDSVKQYDYNAGVYTLSYISAYNYDSKTNPLQLNNDAILLYHFSLLGTNNATKEEAIFIGNPSYNNSSTGVYTYRSDNRPATATRSLSPSGKIFNDTYFYQ